MRDRKFLKCAMGAAYTLTDGTYVQPRKDFERASTPILNTLQQTMGLKVEKPINISKEIVSAVTTPTTKAPANDLSTELEATPVRHDYKKGTTSPRLEV